MTSAEKIIHMIQTNQKNAEENVYKWARGLNEVIKARASMLEMLQAEGKTIQKEEIETWLYNKSRHNRDIWLGFAQTVSTEMAEALGCDSKLLYDLLQEQVRKNLERIATIPDSLGGDTSEQLPEGADAPANP